MARRPSILPNAQREAREKLINAAPLVSDHKDVEEVGVELNFVDPEGKQKPSPRGASYASDMHAYFHFTCPMRDCVGGGFEAHADLSRALQRRRNGHTGAISCQGKRPRSGLKDPACNIELRYTLSIRTKQKKAAA
jgi:hypothetical protein